jgi:hypothetical protein
MSIRKPGAVAGTDQPHEPGDRDADREQFPDGESRGVAVPVYGVPDHVPRRSAMLKFLEWLRKPGLPWTRAGTVAGLLLLGLVALAGAVSVSPVALYLGPRERSGALTLYNPGTRPEEVEIDFAFGYPQSDEEGNVTVPISAEAPEGEPSALGWLRAFPRRLVLEPGQRQVVRILAEPPANLPEGEYWARVLVKGKGGQPPIERQRGNVRVQIDVETVVVAALSYRNGDLTTGIEVKAASAQRAADAVIASVDMERIGSAAFIGRLRAELIDGRGAVVSDAEEVLAVYRTLRRKLPLQVPAGAAGPFRVRFRMDTDRSDLPPGAALPAGPVLHEVTVGGG